MDKRVFTAFFLSIVVALAYNIFVMKPQYEKQQLALKQQRAAQAAISDNEAQQENTVSAVQPAQPAQDVVPVQPAVQPTAFSESKESPFLWVKSDTEREIILENNRLIATFSTTGACLKNLIVKETKQDDFNLFVPFNYSLQPMHVKIPGLINASPEFSVQKQDEHTLIFTRTHDSFIEQKTISLKPDNYQFDVTYSITSNSSTALAFEDGIEFSLGIVQRFSATDKQEVPTAITYLDQGKGEIKTIKLLSKKAADVQGSVLWGCVKNKYFTLIAKPNTPFAALAIDDPTPLEKSDKILSALQSPRFVVQPGGTETFSFMVYSGPQLVKNLKAYKSDFEQSMYFTGWFGPVNRALIATLNWIYSWSKNYGIAIILLTILVKILFYPLTHKSFVSMKHMQSLQPKIAVLKEKYKDNQQKLQQEMVALYKREKVNPLGGCLPMLLQLPVFYGLFRTLSNAYELIGAQFLWIDSLSQPDLLYQIEYGGHTFPVNILPLLMGGTMFIQQKSSTVDPQQQKMMMMMPVLFTFILYNLPSGLVLYWTLSNVLSIFQQKFVKDTLAKQGN